MLEVNVIDKNGINIIEIAGRVVYESENEFRKAIMDLISQEMEIELEQL
jgi:hypothetical protein